MDLSPARQAQIVNLLIQQRRVPVDMVNDARRLAQQEQARGRAVTPLDMLVQLGQVQPETLQELAAQVPEAAPAKPASVDPAMVALLVVGTGICLVLGLRALRPAPAANEPEQIQGPVTEFTPTVRKDAPNAAEAERERAYREWLEKKKAKEEEKAARAAGGKGRDDAAAPSAPPDPAGKGAPPDAAAQGTPPDPAGKGAPPDAAAKGTPPDPAGKAGGAVAEGRASAPPELQDPGKMAPEAVDAAGGKALDPVDFDPIRRSKLLTLETPFERVEPATHEVREIVLGPDGARALTREATGVYQLLEVSAGRPLKAVADPGGTGPTAAALSADGKRALAGWDGRAVEVWDAEPGVLLGKLEGHKGAVRALAFLPGSQRAVSAGADHTVRLWDLEKFKELRQYSGHPFAVTCVAVSPDGKRLLTAGEGSTPILWDVGTGNQFRTLQGKETLAGLRFLTDAARAIGWTAKGNKVRVWDLATGKIAREAGTSADAVARTVAADGSLVVDAGSDGRLRIWDAGTGETKDELDFSRHALQPTSVALDLEHGILLVGTTRAHVLRYRIARPGAK